MTTQAKVALDKQKHPERYCPKAGCLWKTMRLNREKQTYERNPAYPTGYCPRHSYLAQDVALAKIEGSF